MTTGGVGEHGSMVRPIWGERVSGDAAIVEPLDGGVLVGIVDALGHGPEAHAIAAEITAFLHAHARYDVIVLLSRLHEHVRGTRGTRGAAVSIASVQQDGGCLRFAGVGNVSARRLGSNETRLVAQDGMIGGLLPRVREERLTLDDGDLLVFATDGVRSHFPAAEVAGLYRDAPSSVARTIVRRFGKQHDDAACLVLRYRR